MIKSAKAWFEAAHNRKVSKTVSGIPTVEDWPQHKEYIIKSLLSQGAKEEDIKVNDDGISIERQFFMVLKMRKHDEGVLKVRSADYVFTSSICGGDFYGDKKGAKVVDGDLVKTIDKMFITYKILEA